MRWCHESELVERCGRIVVSIRICDPRSDEGDQSGLLVNGSQTLKECVLSVCQGLEANEQGPVLSGRALHAPFFSCLFFRQRTGHAGTFSRTVFRPAALEEPAYEGRHGHPFPLGQSHPSESNPVTASATRVHHLVLALPVLPAATDTRAAPPASAADLGQFTLLDHGFHSSRKSGWPAKGSARAPRMGQSSMCSVMRSS